VETGQKQDDKPVLLEVEHLVEVPQAALQERIVEEPQVEMVEVVSRLNSKRGTSEAGSL